MKKVEREMRLGGYSWSLLLSRPDEFSNLRCWRVGGAEVKCPLWIVKDVRLWGKTEISSWTYKSVIVGWL